MFVLGVDGRYEVRRYDGVKSYGTNMVNPAKAKPTKAVDRSGPNVLRAECTGTKKAKLVFFVNGKKVVTVTDPKPPKGAAPATTPSSSPRCSPASRQPSSSARSASPRS